MNKDKTIQGIINKLASRYRVDSIYVEEVVEDILKRTKEKMKDPHVPRVLIHNLGTFQPSVLKLNVRIKGIVRKYLARKITKEEAKAILYPLFAARRRLKLEEHSKKHNKNGRKL